MSDDAVSAVGVVNQYIFMCILIMEVLSNGASIVVAQYIGARRFQEAARLSALAITLNFAVGLMVSAGLLLFGNPFCLSLSLGYLFVFKLNLGLAGVWLAVSADEWTRGIVFWFRWKSRAWERQSLVTPVEQPAVAAAAG